MEVPAKRVAEFEDMKSPGDFVWHFNENNDPTQMTFLCPCGCGAYLGVSVAGKVAWEWNQDLEKPTTTPSIRYLDGCHWHGYLTDGVFRSC